LVLIFTALLLVSCGGSGSDQASTDDSLADVELRLRDALDAHYSATGVDFTLLLRAESGQAFEHSTGSSSASTVYRSASTSKWVTAAVILYLVETDVLSLEDKPQQWIDFWPEVGNLASIELRHLLNFTSGLNDEPLCINLPSSNFESCVETIKNRHLIDAPIPGSEFYYSPTHMQVAGLMAIKATGLSSWGEVFDFFKLQTGLFSQASYSLPSVTNPRLAGGMQWAGEEYMAFLSDLYQEKFLSPALTAQMLSNQIGSATIVYSPLEDTELSWPYGYGNWIECDPSIGCGQATRVSSIGSYGAYPFIDFEHQYIGLLAREGDLSTAMEGYDTYQMIAADLVLWAAMANDGIVESNSVP